MHPQGPRRESPRRRLRENGQRAICEMDARLTGRLGVASGRGLGSSLAGESSTQSWKCLSLTLCSGSAAERRPTTSGICLFAFLGHGEQSGVGRVHAQGRLWLWSGAEPKMGKRLVYVVIVIVFGSRCCVALPLQERGQVDLWLRLCAERSVTEMDDEGTTDLRPALALALRTGRRWTRASSLQTSGRPRPRHRRLLSAEGRTEGERARFLLDAAWPVAGSRPVRRAVSGTWPTPPSCTCLEGPSRRGSGSRLAEEPKRRVRSRGRA